jgi:zinc-finger of transposase IS204/IS1001/IS1096/IS1165
MCALLVGLPDVTVLGVADWPSWLRIVIETDHAPPSCCGLLAHRHGVREVELVDLPVFGRPARLVWNKQRWRCPTCRRAWTEQDPEIASARCGFPHLLAGPARAGHGQRRPDRARNVVAWGARSTPRGVLRPGASSLVAGRRPSRG